MAFHSHFEISSQIHTPEYSMYAPHTHAYHELYYLSDGRCDLLVSDNTYLIESGTFVFIPANTLHQTSYLNAQDNKRIYIEFSTDYLSDLASSLGQGWLENQLYNKIIYIPLAQRQPLIVLLDTMMQEHSHSLLYSENVLKMCLEQLLLLLVRQNHDNPGYLSGSSTKVIDKSIKKAMNYISQNYQSDISLNDIAQLLHLNPSYLSKKFKVATGIGFKEYLNNVRINQSEKLLLETNYNITDIAFACGYENSNYYGDAFRRRNGISPTDFRRAKGNVKG